MGGTDNIELHRKVCYTIVTHGRLMKPVLPIWFHCCIEVNDINQIEIVGIAVIYGNTKLERALEKMNKSRWGSLDD